MYFSRVLSAEALALSGLKGVYFASDEQIAPRSQNFEVLSFIHKLVVKYAPKNMNQLIVAETPEKTKNLPRAIAKEKDGIVMFWVDELDEGGLHLKALAKLLDCDAGNLGKFIKTVYLVEGLEAELLTVSGFKTVYLYKGTDLAKILRAIERSKMAQVVKDRAGDLRDQLAASGFKLAVMLQLAPEKLAAQAQAHVDKEIRLQELKLQTAKLVGDLSTMHGKELAMAAIGLSDQVVKVETVVTEVVNGATRHVDRIFSADQLKRVVADRSGQKIKNASTFVKAIKAAGRDDLLLAVTRSVTGEYVAADKIEEAIEVVYGTAKQKLLSPTAELAWWEA